MGKRFYFRDSDALSTLSTSFDKVLSTQPGSAIVTGDALSATGPTSVQIRRDGSAVIWYTAPCEAISISGPITINLWGKESNIAANAGFRAFVETATNAGAAALTIIDSTELTELTTSFSQRTITGTPGSPISLTAGQRIRVRLFATDVGGTMASGHTISLEYGAPEGTEGFSWIEFTEDIALQVYPTPSQDGPQYLKYLKRIKDFKEITVQSQFEDGGVDVLERALDAPQRWEFTYDGLSESEAEVLDNFWLNHRLSQHFSLIEPRDFPWTHVEGDTFEDVQFESYTKDHSKVDVQSRDVVLVKYPA